MQKIIAKCTRNPCKQNFFIPAKRKIWSSCQREGTLTCLRYRYYFHHGMSVLQEHIVISLIQIFVIFAREILKHRRSMSGELDQVEERPFTFSQSGVAT
ncbi:uncharacterized protein LOC105185961 isoform X3 [Harpegnathos saltator]|uniref:uncharacterized protein LOC105185961 isoform X3 n=1 Tax=Harpegnathos saltator TaxID=610380 RepID=UPI0009489EDC|nr:uncharacterized protein LOC105185961 isoform X3 [Harpegnathos saltator]